MTSEDLTLVSLVLNCIQTVLLAWIKANGAGKPARGTSQDDAGSI